MSEKTLSRFCIVILLTTLFFSCCGGSFSKRKIIHKKKLWHRVDRITLAILDIRRGHHVNGVIKKEKIGRGYGTMEHIIAWTYLKRGREERKKRQEWIQLIKYIVILKLVKVTAWKVRLEAIFKWYSHFVDIK